MDLQLKNRIVLITGASKGLGLATAKQFAMEGANVIINSRNELDLKIVAEQLQVETQSKVTFLAGDITDPVIPQRLAGRCQEEFGGLDILISNAGGPPPGAFETISDDVWNNALNLSFLANVRLIRACLPLLRQSPIASVLTITSISVKQPIVNMVLSNSIRAATIGLTKTLALELGMDRIRFNSILPGWTETDRVTQLLGRRAEANGTTIEQEYQKQAAESPLGRLAKPEEFANAAVFLSSPAASYLTGVMLPVDGGMYKATY